MSSTDNKRIAKNTIFLYIRMIIAMAVSFFTIRIVLENLGIEDYGIYNVIGGLSSSFVFFQSALTNATQRFLNFNLGRNSHQELGQIFNLSLEIYVVIAILVFLIGTTVGVWFVADELNIRADKINAAIIVLLATLVLLAFSFVTSVYEAVLISRENMKIYAYIGLFEAFAKLIVAYLIVVIPFDKLISYAVLLTIVGIIPKAILIAYCSRHYSETKIQPFWNKSLFREMFAFSGWNIYGCGVWMINQQGINILLNIFFGPVVNAARGVAFQVTNVVNNFVTNFFTAVRPQIVKTYAAGELQEFRNLIFMGSRFSTYLVWMFFLPIFLRVDFLLSIWLTEVPEYTAVFIKWVLCFTLIDVLNNPLWSAIQAVGRLRKTIMYGSTIFLMAFPISYIFLKAGSPPWVVYPVLTCVRVIYLVVVFRILNEYVSISGNEYFKKVVRPMLLTIIGSSIVMFPVNSLIADDALGFVIVSAISLVVNIVAIFAFGLSRAERQILLLKLSNAISKDKE